MKESMKNIHIDTPATYNGVEQVPTHSKMEDKVIYNVKTDKKCDLCRSSVIDGAYGESKYTCQNVACERSNPSWAAEERKKKIEPYLEKMESLKKFDGVTIDFHEARWKGNGSAEITLSNGDTFKCHVLNDQFEPFDNEYFDELNINISNSQILQIKSSMLELIKLRDELYKM